MRYRLIILLIVVCYSPGLAQKKKDKNATATGIQNPPNQLGSMQKFPGFVEFYYDQKHDKIFLAIEKFDMEFLYVNSLSAGVGSNDIGLDRGQLGRERVVKFERRGPKILLVEPNYRYRAITDNRDEKRAVEEAFAQSVLWGFKVESEESGKAVVDATDFFLSDAHDVIGRLKNPMQGTYTLDKSRSAFYLPRVKNFPENSEFEATLTFTGQPADNFIRSVTPTPTSVTVRQHHSFVQLPDNKYEPRAFDPRAGYFPISYYDYATPINEPIEKRFITRHRLEKKDPSSAMSEAVEPIVYYLDRGTPEPIRSALLDGARWWDQAFEAAGYKDAFRVEILPENADPMDVRYNLIQWVHRSTRGWSYGASVINPRTGEIIKGHVSLGSLRVRQDFLIAEGLLAPYKEGDPVSKQMEAMALARLRQLSAHEIGHTLGLAHSYSSSTEGLASVMDYPHPVAKLENGKIDLTNAYDDKIGAWDKVAIAYGYQDFPDDTDEKRALVEIIEKSLKEGLTFLSDQDARPIGGAHPYSHLWDNGKNAADELQRVLDIRQVALKNFGENNIKTGAPMATLEETLVPMYFFHRYQTEAAAKIIGGLNYRYALRGDGQPVTEMVSPAEQRAALEVLLKTVSPNALKLSEALLRSIPPRPIGYSRHRELMKTRTGLTFDALSGPEAAADLTISLLLHSARANRLVEHHARDNRQPSLDFLIDEILNATIKSAPLKDYEAAIQMTVNEVTLNNLLDLALAEESNAVTRAMSAFKIEQLRSWLETRAKSVGEIWKAHFHYLISRIRQFQEAPQEFKTAPALDPPPGQPIGMYDLQYCSEDQ